MQDMTAVEVKAFVPSKDFAPSKRFYQDLGFKLGWSSDDLATVGRQILSAGSASGAPKPASTTTTAFRTRQSQRKNRRIKAAGLRSAPAV